MSELVSIIIPAYNAEQWIDETVRSALAQTWPRKEIIIVDDGSTDSTLAVAKGYESKFVKVVTQSNQGVSTARNKGLAFAQGSYIQWLDADDLLARDKISRQLQSAEQGLESRILLSSSFGAFYFCRERVKVNPTVLWQDLTPVEWMINKLYYNAWIGLNSWLVSRKLTTLAGPWNEQLVRDNDGEYICRVIAASEKVRFVPEAMSYCRNCSVASVSKNLSEKARKSVAMSINLCTGYLLSLEKSERTRKACVNYMQSYMSLFYPENKAILVELTALASELGGQLAVPSVKWKYVLLDKLLGRRVTKQVMKKLAGMKFRAAVSLDQYLCGLLHDAH